MEEWLAGLQGVLVIRMLSRCLLERWRGQSWLRKRLLRWGGGGGTVVVDCFVGVKMVGVGPMMRVVRVLLLLLFVDV